ncbi:regulatory protein, luxR family [Paenibacillus sp. UNCCL117]|uniref:helix-turn-helix domain-containing protein n=1 Tax=unclassified Paenibacillus TaxID=185978 RepID=UPI000883FA05|nr:MULTISPECIES: helix-turn-helix transcriptional regulator [unclassified Paenibacillus]SDC11800.1 regulatory protein, luxR family [Paenibacillus sp. cl123]SFW16688.1 regulatory protein, luxR family [Paenibacillus sp. UNCCL117]
MRQTIGQRLNNLMFDQFVGRSFETGLFQQFVNHLSDRTERILNVFGTAGIGKTYLLAHFALIAEELNAIPIQVDLQEINGDTAAFERAVLHGIGMTTNHNNEAAANQSILELSRLTEDKKVVLLIDGYEEAGSLDYWMRTFYFPRLPTNILIVVAGRYPLEGLWRYSAWKNLIVRLPLSALTYEDIRQYLLNGGVTDEEAIDAVWLRTLGHPIAVSLLAPAPGELTETPDFSASAGQEPIEAMLDRWLLDRWLLEAPDDELRRLLLASSAVRTFQQELLEELIGKPISPGAFDHLIKLSFVSRSSGGWRLHDMVWEAMRRTFRERMPEQFEQYNRIAVAFAEKKLEDGIAQGKNISKELAELLHYTGNPILRAHYRHTHASPNYREPLNEQNSQELETYLIERKKRPRAWHVICSDPESQELYRFSFTPEESLLRLAAVNWPDVLSMSDGNRSVQLLRNVAGRVIGVFTVVAVNSETWDYLASAAVSRALFQSISEDQQRQLSAAAAQGKAWYLLSVDVEDLENDQTRSDIVAHLFEYVLAGNLIVTSPPPLDYYDQAMSGFGFKKIQGADHNDYGLPKPASTYWLDTRNDNLRAYVKRMIGTERDDAKQLPLPQKAQPIDLTIPRHELTKRENDVAQLLLAGCTNREIAASLYISEAAVKKHVNAMLAKFGLKNRTQLAAALLGGEAKM